MTTALTEDRARAERWQFPRHWARWLLSISVLLTLILAGYLPKKRARAALISASAEANQAVSAVNVVRPKPTKPSKSISLPASLKGWEQAVIYARANGYVRRWLVDLGDQVEQGQPLAELDTPELDREVEQARAGLAESGAVFGEAEANRDYAEVNLARYRSLAPAGVASQGELQKAEAEARVAAAKLAVTRAARDSRSANLRRLEQLKSFARVTAPFAGAVTARKVDRGSLVTAGTSILFELSVLKPLRVVIDVPQSLALGVRDGTTGKLSVRELPGRSFSATVARRSGALDSTSRTLRVELLVPNDEHQLLPGMFAEVTLELARSHTSLSLPASAVIGSKDGLRVATVDARGLVKLNPIVIERDNGSEVEIASGISPEDTIISSPRPFLSEGEQVKPALPNP
ncbi:MAG TPA: efflux RND transporter periplasmic adaptor subunit [Polyangiaceae bacterium]|nr:efflux RND transporter periplasmic adaptor subunit [Polyangiaceae bacterium]